jgi:DNA-binding NtrC family response regulator
VRDVERLLGLENAGSPEPSEGPSEADFEGGLPHMLEEAERSWIEAALRRYSDESRAQLAARLGISEAALYRKLRRYGLGG